MLEALRQCATATRLSEPDAAGARVARQARHAVSALLSHALPPCRRRLLVACDVTPSDAAAALGFSIGGGSGGGGHGSSSIGAGAGSAGGGAFSIASDGALDFLDWLWPLAHAPHRGARRLAQQLHARLCLEVEMAAAEAAAEGGYAAPSGGGGAGSGVGRADSAEGECRTRGWEFV